MLKGLLFAGALYAFSSPTAAQDLNLLPTVAVAQEVRRLHDVLQSQTVSRKKQDAAFRQLQSRISEFVIAQLEAELRLEPRHLRDELVRILGKKSTTTGSRRDSRTAPEEEDPFVQRWPDAWGPKETGPVVWGVTYSDQHHDGFMGSRIVVESYVVRDGKARLAGRGGSELDGVAMHANRMWNPRSGLAVLIDGVVQWSSGHALPSKAALYAIDAEGVHLTWKIETGSLQVLPAADGSAFTLIHHDEGRHQSTGGFDSTSVIEVYVIGPDGLKRRVHQRF